MNDFLTPKQKVILNRIKEKDFLTLMDFKSVYSSRPEEQLKRLIELGYLIEDIEHFGHFKYTGKEF